MHKLIFIVCVLWASTCSLANAATHSECVVLLHGLNRTERAMRPLQRALEQEGYHVVNNGYPSRDKPIEALMPYLDKAIDDCHGSSPVHFVTHSMGGVLVRVYFADHSLADLGRVVMLGPPNHGSEIVDLFGGYKWFEILNGPAGIQLGTSENFFVKLGAVDYDVGVVAGDRSINLLLSQMLPKPNDGKVSVESTYVDGMSDHITLPVTHTFMMRDVQVIEQIIAFLKSSKFRRN